MVDPAALDAMIDAYENRIGPRNGARVVARRARQVGSAELDLTEAYDALRALPDYKRKLQLDELNAAIRELLVVLNERPFQKLDGWLNCGWKPLMLSRPAAGKTVCTRSDWPSPK